MFFGGWVVGSTLNFNHTVWWAPEVSGGLHRAAPPTVVTTLVVVMSKFW